MAKLALQLQRIVVVLIFFVIVIDQYVCGTSEPLHIYRGDYDKFDNPTCLETRGCSNCTAMNAYCNITDTNSRCCQCTCFGQYRTYLRHFGRSRSTRCVKDNRLLFFPVRPNSFLIQDFSKDVCITYNRSNNLTVAKCNSSDLSQQWIRTRHRQLLHVDTSKCIQQGEEYPGRNHTWYLGLEECSIRETRQEWNCSAEFLRRTFHINDQQRFMYMTYENDTIYAKVDAAKHWKRYGTEISEQICSSSFGCNEFTNPSSAILVLDTKGQRQGEQQIAGLSEREKCVVNYLQSWNYVWKRLEFTENIFLVTDTKNFPGKFLKWDLKRAPSNLSNFIIKLNFNCTPVSKRSTAASTRCVLIKLKYNPYPDYPTTASSTPPTASFINSNASLPTSTITTKSPTSSQEKQQAESSSVVGIVVGLVVAILVLSGIILGFFYYKRRSRLDKTSSNVEINGKDQSSRDTSNPIYSSEDKNNGSFLNDGGVYQEPDGNMGAASQACGLYESVDDHECDYPKTEQENKPAPSLEELEYDYARNDDIRSAVQRLPVKGNDYYIPNINASTNSSEDKEIEKENDTGLLYQTLENDTGPVYQTLEDK